MINSKLTLLKIWTPRVMILLVIGLALVTFWALLHFAFLLFGTSSYFTPQVQTGRAVPGIDEEQTTKLRDFLKNRAVKREGVTGSQNFGQKDPFGLP